MKSGKPSDGAVWERRAAWCDEAEAALGELIAADRRSLMANVAAGNAHLYHARSSSYDLWALLDFFERVQDGGKQCEVVAIRGRGCAAGLKDLIKLCSARGVDSVICETTSPALYRLYERAGFKEAWRVFVAETQT